VPYHQIRAIYTDTTVTVYQAYPPAVAEPALTAGRFVSPFKRDRMTWIKPSFLWMMYRCGWGEKRDQEVVLAVEITRAGFEWALEHACLSHYERDRHGSHAEWTRHLEASPVRVQWDPERGVDLQPLAYRSLQVGLSGEAVTRYVDEWTVSITDVTPLARAVRAGAHDRVPDERPYPYEVPAAIA
jgi:hypothetical protein